VALVEAAIAEACATGASRPAAASVETFRQRQDRAGTNRFGLPLARVLADGPRGNLASAIGLSLAGTRATAFLAAADLAAAQDLMAFAASSHLPLVAHLCGGHDVYHAAAGHGWLQLFARNAQEAADLTLVARRVAEAALLPALVAMDDDAVGHAVQDVLLPPDELVREFVGDPRDQVAAVTPAQELLFGDLRPRVPRWFDLERPMLHGARHGGPSSGPRAASSRPYFLDHVPDLLAAAFETLALTSGRSLDVVSSHRLDDAELVVMAQGAAVETAEAVADHVREHHGFRVGVLGLRCLRPFPRARLQALLAGKKAVVVLERVDANLALEPPLTRELRAALELPRMHTALYGLGGSPLRGADLHALCLELRNGGRPLVYLGVDFAPGDSSYPKRQVLLENLRRSYPDVAGLGLKTGPDAALDLRPEQSLTIAVHRVVGEGGEDLAPAAASLLAAALRGGGKGRVRSRLDVSHDGYAAACTDHFTLGSETLRDPGDDTPVEVAVLLSGRSVAPVATGGAVLFARRASETVADVLSADVLRRLSEQKLQVFEVIVPDAPAAHETPTPEELLGGLVGLLQQRGAEVPTRRVRSAREEALDFLDEASRAACMAAFDAGVEAVRRVDPHALSVPEAPAAEERSAPLAVRHLATTADTLDSLPRFWDQVGVLYRGGETEELAPDPYLAVPAVPPLSATFRDFSAARKTLPVLDPLACTGCGDCWTACPDGAIGPVAIGFQGLLESGMAKAQQDGQNVGALRAVVQKIAQRGDSIMAGEPAPQTAGGVLAQAFDWVLDKMAPAADRREALTAAFGPVLDAVGRLPVARTAVFFDHRDAKAKEVLALAINPDACKACEACTAACAVDALHPQEQTPELVAAAREVWQLWERLPDTAGATIAYAADHVDVGKAAALLLSRHCLLAISGGDAAEAGSGEKVALRLMMAAAECHLQPNLQRHLEDVATLKAQFDVKIRELLAQALPIDDLDNLATGLSGLGETHVDLADLTRQVEELGEKKLVDATWLASLVETARELEDLRFRLGRGARGPRARVGVCLAQGNVAAWAGAFPYNPFPVPVAIDSSGEAAQLARGLCEGQLRAIVQDFRLLRRARLVLERPVEAREAQQQLLSLTYDDLTAEERQLCPPLLLVGGDDALGGRSLSQLSALLSSQLPVKVLVLAGLDAGLADGSGLGRDAEASGSAVPDLGLLALAHRTAYVAQSSIGFPDHLVDSCLAAFGFDGPALVHVHAPSPQRHGFPAAATMAQARRAVSCRAFPLFTFDPAREGVFGSRLELAGNPDDAARPTLADWAMTEARFAACFVPLGEDDPAPTPLAEFLALEAGSRGNKTPYVTIAVGDETETRLRVLPAMVAVAEDRLHSWRTLQELAGVVTPFTAHIQEAAEQTVAAEHKTEIEALKQEYEARFETIRAEVEREFTARLQKRLTELAHRQRNRLGAN
jgi:pyruvate-ferredoxin/flavodoxin oxidoreductase